MRPFLKLARPDPPSFQYFAGRTEAVDYQHPVRLLDDAETCFLKAITLLLSALKQSDSDAVGKVLSEDAWEKVSASVYRATHLAPYE